MEGPVRARTSLALTDGLDFFLGRQRSWVAPPPPTLAQGELEHPEWAGGSVGGVRAEKAFPLSLPPLLPHYPQIAFEGTMHREGKKHTTWGHVSVLVCSAATAKYTDWAAQTQTLISSLCGGCECSIKEVRVAERAHLLEGHRPAVQRPPYDLI